MSLFDPHPNSGRLVHQILAHGYLVYLAAIVVGFGANYLWPNSTSFSHESGIGFMLIVLGTVLIYWAQYTSGATAQKRNTENPQINKNHFLVGPYKFTRSPTQYGLFLMAFGLAFLFGSLSMVITTILALVIGKFFIIKEEERQLEQKYGTAYTEYKKEVRF